MSGFELSPAFYEWRSQQHPGWALRACLRHTGHRETDLAFGVVHPDGRLSVVDVGLGTTVDRHPRHEIRCVEWIVRGYLIDEGARQAIWTAFWILEIEAHADAGTAPRWAEHLPDDWAFWEKARAREREAQQLTAADTLESHRAMAADVAGELWANPTREQLALVGAKARVTEILTKLKATNDRAKTAEEQRDRLLATRNVVSVLVQMIEEELLDGSRCPERGVLNIFEAVAKELGR